MVSEMECVERILLKLFEIEAIKFGEFKLKSGLLSPIYINLRVIIGYPKLLRELSELLYNESKNNDVLFDLTCGVPYTALPLATCMSLDHDLPMVIRRREAKDYGTKQMIEGVYKNDDVCLVVEDVVTSGGSVLETVKELNNVGLVCKDAVVLLDRGQGGKEMLKSNGINLHSVLEMQFVLDVLLEKKKIEQTLYDQCVQFIKTNQFEPVNKKIHQNGGDSKQKVLSYLDRRSLVSNNVAKRIFEIMETKQTNLAFSVDVTECAEVLRLIDLVGPHCCVVKTHVDILTDFNQDFIRDLTALSKKHNFVLFEDRKFADIGNTVKHQYSGGMYNISDWAELTNAHSIPGEGVVNGLKTAAASNSSGKDRACLLIAQMSSAGALTETSYTNKTVEMAKNCSDFVIGFICTSAVCAENRFIYMTPGVSIQAGGDALGQTYLSPEEVIKNRRCDIIIVGRGIYQALDPAEAALSYKEAGYKAYTELVNV